MPLQNRVLPTGDIVAIPARGTLTGNRGIIHRDDRTLGTSRWSHHAWISCTLEWQGRKRQVMTGRNWTELFFLDEAVAMAAGHRPCGYCRRADYRRFATAWGDKIGAKAMDRVLHRSRVVKGRRDQLRYGAQISDLPSGSFILHRDQPHLVLADRLLPYTPDGYAPPIDRPRGQSVTVLTPAPMIAVLRAGYTPALHPTATIDLSSLKA